MNTWRNLMTPLYEKCYSRENHSPGLSGSNSNYQLTSQQTKDSLMTIKSSRRDLKNGSIYYERISQLKNEMNKLKVELIKNPKSARSAIITTTKKDPCMIDYVKFDKKLKSTCLMIDKKTNERLEEKKTQQANFSQNSFFKKTAKAYEGFQQMEKTALKKPKQQQQKSLLGNDIGVITTFRDNNGLKYCKESEENKRIVEEESISLEQLKDNTAFQGENIEKKPNTFHAHESLKSLQSSESESDSSTVSAKNNHSGLKGFDLNKPKHSLKKILETYKEEIAGLKGIVMESTEKIYHLQDELETEKRNSENLRQKIDKLTTEQDKPIRNNEESHYQYSYGPSQQHYFSKMLFKNQKLPKNPGPCLRRKKLSTTSNQDTNYTDHVDSSSLSKNIISTSLDNVDIFEKFREKHKQNRYSFSTKSISFHDNNQIYQHHQQHHECQDHHCGQDQDHEIKNSDKSLSQNMMLRKSSIKETSIQCDLILDRLADLDSENDIKDLKDQLEKKNTEINRLKQEKNELIQVFQNIVKVLAKPSNPHPIKQKLNNLNQKFSDFYEILKAKLNDINTTAAAISTNPNPSDELTKGISFENTISIPMSTIKLKDYRNDVSENLMYSISNHDYTSFIDQLNPIEREI